jgi:putative endonuclease
MNDNSTIDIGRRGELAAQEYLEKEGFTIRHTNWRCGHKELDIVAHKDNTLHIIEVKTRAAACIVAPQTSIDRQKQRNTIAAANIYAERMGINDRIQLDVIIVLMSGADCQITYIPNAYYPFVK